MNTIKFTGAQTPALSGASTPQKTDNVNTQNLTVAEATALLVDAIRREESNKDPLQNFKEMKSERAKRIQEKTDAYAKAITKQTAFKNLQANGWKEKSTGQWTNERHKAYIIQTNGGAFVVKKDNAVLGSHWLSPDNLNTFLKTLEPLDVSTVTY